MESTCCEFKNILTNICAKEDHDGILLSGGLDSSILAYHIKPKYSITISIDKESPDYYYSSLIAKKRYSINHHMINIPYNEVLTNIEELIEEFKTFDPIFLKNSVVQLIGFKIAKEMNINSLVIGDGADELFAGYNFYTNILQTRKDLKKNQLINSEYGLFFYKIFK
ncbi:MAG: asparagine synthase C-terminal domain-containing protein [Candidatus Nitrosocosmicus sp.]